jgi:ADP-ribose pyrophosphatase YjhB (NUDIX family)
MLERRAHFCPMCGTPLETQARYGRDRPVCPSCQHTVFFDPKTAVVAFVTRERESKREILLIQRANDPGKGKWSLPAGFVEYDEDPRAAAARETLEESGVIVQVERLIELLHRPDLDGLADIVIAYAAVPTGGAVSASDDATDAGWFAEDALPEIVLASARMLIARWLAHDL